MSDEVRDAEACCEKTVKVAMQRLRIEGERAVARHSLCSHGTASVPVASL